MLYLIDLERLDRDSCQRAEVIGILSGRTCSRLSNLRIWIAVKNHLQVLHVARTVAHREQMHEDIRAACGGRDSGIALFITYAPHRAVGVL